ncbi:hypothetical protein AB0D67_11680 [Streptosporangium sp. NPDC048047]|uniref:hypothetical protein n=1 Tax=Streptosporangium sp. NPDC048047 TaxID=3155748 RepID=UPI0034475E79
MIPFPAEVREGWRIAGLAVRIVLLAVLLTGALVAVLSYAPTARTLTDFRAAVAADRVSAVLYREHGGLIREVRWSEGLLVWHQVVDLPVSRGKQGYAAAEFWPEISRVPPRAVSSFGDRDDPSGILPDWPFRVLRYGGIPWLAGAWGISFLIMLGSMPRLASRWAWIWLFTVGQVGAIGFLLLEPRPLWFRGDRQPAPVTRMSGWQGLAMSIGLALAAVLVAMGVGMLARLLLG